MLQANSSELLLNTKAPGRQIAKLSYWRQYEDERSESGGALRKVLLSSMLVGSRCLDVFEFRGGLCTTNHRNYRRYSEGQNRRADQHRYRKGHQRGYRVFPVGAEQRLWG